MRTTIIGFLVCFTTVTTHAADWSSRNTVHLGTTSNANLERDAPVSDSYLKASTSNGVRAGDHALNLRLSYVDYRTESQNDVFSFALSNTSSSKSSEWRYGGSLVGSVYTYWNPGTTDDSFTHYGFDLVANRNLEVGSEKEVEIGGGYRFRLFPSLDTRNDHTVFGSANMDFDLSDRLIMNVYGELGLTASSESDYSRIFLELGSTVDYLISSNLTWTSDISISRSAFTSRTVSTTTIVDRRRGNDVIGTLTERETYGSFNLSTEVTRQETETFRWGGGLFASRHSSKSGSQDYSVLQALIHLSVKF